MQKIKVRSQNSEVRGREEYFLLALFSFLSLLLLLYPHDSSAFWPFTPKKPYIAKVGGEVITTEEFLEEVDKLHKSSRAGMALEEQKSFAIQDFGKFLNELIDNKLMMVEATNLGLDKETYFIATLDNYVLNLSLERLRQDEILSNIKVEDKEIEDYYQEQIKKKAEEKKKDEAKSEDVKKEEEKKEEPPKMSEQDRDAIRKGFFTEKVKAREKEYFAEIRKVAQVKIDGEALSALSAENTDLYGKTVAEVNGEPILGRDVLRNLGGSKDEKAKNEALEKLIVYKVLDQEALRRGYDKKEDRIKEKVKAYRDRLLIDIFKRRIILPTIKVEEKDILDYYNANKEKYKESDKAAFRMIHVESEEDAKGVASDLKTGADFAYLAREKSTDPSKERGGDIGWVPVNNLTEEMRKAVDGAKEGDILGPFALSGGGYVILELRGIETGSYIPVDKVKSEIDRTIGTERFNAALTTYLKRLRETIRVEINQKELDRIQGR